jgi:hypothetical protein
MKTFKKLITMNLAYSGLFVLILSMTSGCTFLQSPNIFSKGSVNTISSGVTRCSRQLGLVTQGIFASGNEVVTGIRVDSQGNTYLTGMTDGNLGETNGGGMDVFVIKLTASCQVEFVKQLGAVTMGPTAAAGDENVGIFGSAAANGRSVAIDSQDNLYIVGSTSGDLFETNANLSTKTDIFIFKMDPHGNLVWSKQWGAVSASAAGWDATGGDQAFTVQVDASDNIWVSIQTTGSLFETNGGGPFGSDNDDIGVMKLNLSGQVLMAKQYGAVTKVGTQSNYDREELPMIELLPSGGAVLGMSASHDFAYPGANGSSSSNDLVYLKIDANGNPLAARQVGTNEIPLNASTHGGEYTFGLGVDTSNNIYLAGVTTADIGETGGSPGDVVLAKFDASDTFQWIKQLGTVTLSAAANNSAEFTSFLRITPDQNVIIGGMTQSDLFDTKSAGAFGDSFLVSYSPSGTLLWGRQYGANHSSTGMDVTALDLVSSAQFDGAGNLVLGGITDKLFEANSGGFDAFMMVVNPQNGDLLQ